MPAILESAKIPTLYRIFPPSGPFRERRTLLVERPALRILRRIVEPFLGGARMERVRVLCPASGIYTDMFVDEMGIFKGLPINAAATQIYRNNYLLAHPGTDPESLRHIVGTAVVFLRPVCEDD